MEAAMRIKLLGSECTDCKLFESNLYEAIRLSGIDATIEKVDDAKAIIRHGVVKTPALVIDGRVKVQGRIATVEDITGFIQNVEHYVV
jgi:small redox-active disulfide protein 2